MAVIQSSLMQAHEKQSATRSGRIAHDLCNYTYRMRRGAFEVQQVNAKYNVVGWRMDEGRSSCHWKLLSVAVFLPEASTCLCVATRISSSVHVDCRLQQMHQLVDVDCIVSLIRISIIDSRGLYHAPACPPSSSRINVA